MESCLKALIYSFRDKKNIWYGVSSQSVMRVSYMRKCCFGRGKRDDKFSLQCVEYGGPAGYSGRFQVQQMLVEIVI